MKKFLIIPILIFCSGIALFSAEKKVKTMSNEKTEPETKQVVVYYFHTNYRCASCLKIEQYTKEAVEKYFKNELKSGKLIFKVINVEEEKNTHFINDYKLYTKSVVLSLLKNEKEVKSKNLEKVWDFLRSEQKFTDYVKQEVSLFLKKG